VFSVGISLQRYSSTRFLLNFELVEGNSQGLKMMGHFVGEFEKFETKGEWRESEISGMRKFRSSQYFEGSF